MSDGLRKVTYGPEKVSDDPGKVSDGLGKVQCSAVQFSAIQCS